MGQLVGDGSDGIPGVTGTGTGGSSGIAGVSDSGFGVTGLSTTNGDGVHGASTSGDGVSGTSASSDGVHGVNGAGSGTKPRFGCGVRGDSDNGYGVYGASKTASGVYGTSGSGHLAGEFVGDVAISGTVKTTVATTGILTADSATISGALIANLSVSTSLLTVGSVAAGNVTVSGKVTAQDVIISGMDCAEEFDVANAAHLEPGTVVVFDGEGNISQSTEPYSKRVAGVISGAGKYRPGVILGRDGLSSAGKAAVALVGRVYCKVDADISSIAVGDLLTTSDTAGHAMKVIDPLKGLGSVIGKALQPLESGRGLMPILVTLQ